MTPFKTTPQTKATIQALWRLEKIILDSLNFHEVVQKIVDSVLLELGYLKLGYRIVVLSLVDEKKGVLKRISLSQTPEAERALAASSVPFEKIEIPLYAKDNLMVKAMLTKEPQATHYWPDIFRPVLSPQDALVNQKAAGIKTSMIYPVIVRDKATGVLIFSMIKDVKDVNGAEKDLIKGFTDVVGLAVQNATLYTSLEEASQKLKEANEKLKELDKLKDEFVSVASHELRTPMTAIKSYLWLALYGKAGPLNEKQAHYLDRAYFSNDRLIKLVNNMLNVSRIESGRIELELAKFSMPNLIKDVVEEVTPRANELSIKVVQEKDGATQPVLADYDKIKEVLINLIGNSLKFTSRGGQITISCREKNGMVETSVSDTGKGIAKDDIPKLFHKFGLLDSKDGNYVIAASGGGTGLGLYISKELIKMHGGQIWATSAGAGRGATFTFTLKTTPRRFVVREKKKEEEKVGIIPTTI